MDWQTEFERLDTFFETCTGVMWKIYTTNAPHRQTKKRAIQSSFEDLTSIESLRRLKAALQNQAPTALQSFVVVVVSKPTEAGGQLFIMQNPEYQQPAKGTSGGGGYESSSIGKMLELLDKNSNSRLSVMQQHSNDAINYITQISDLKTNHAIEKNSLLRKIEDLEAQNEFLSVDNSTIGKVVKGVKEPLTSALITLVTKMFIGKNGSNISNLAGEKPTTIPFEETSFEGWEICENLQNEIPDLPTVLQKLENLLMDEQTRPQIEQILDLIRSS